MTPAKWMKFGSWVAFVTLLPVIAYPIGLLIAGVDDLTITLENALELGDILLLVITLLGITMDMLLMSLILNTGAAGGVTMGRLIDYMCFLFAFFSLVIIAAVYGRIVMSKLSGGPKVGNMGNLATIYVTCYLVYAFFGAGVFFRLLRSGRIA